MRRRVGLLGMHGLYNYGCEAIVRGTYELIKKAWPESDVILFTYRVEEDKEIVKDLAIRVTQVPLKSSTIGWRVVNKVLRTVSVEKQFTYIDSNRIISDCDLVFSVGGDIYTVPKYVIDSHMETKHNLLVEIGKDILKKRPMVIWGASIGPFGNRADVKRYFFDHLKQVNLIFCRESATYNYLKKNGVTSNIQLCSDPAFYTTHNPKNDCKQSKKHLRIALNLSPLSIKEQVGTSAERFKREIIDTILDISKETKAELVLVPHVISPFLEDDNDLKYLKEIQAMFSGDNRVNLEVLDNAKGFLETKDFLRTCDLVIAARMHCAVNAICEGIPTIFLTYSQKGSGMTNHIYGDTYWSVPLLRIKAELKDKTVEMIKNKETISSDIKSRVEQIKEEEPRIVDLFRSIM